MIAITMVDRTLFPCLDDDEYVRWVELNERTGTRYHANVPCEDCTVAYRTAQRAKGSCPVEDVKAPLPRGERDNADQQGRLP